MYALVWQIQLRFGREKKNNKIKSGRNVYICFFLRQNAQSYVAKAGLKLVTLLPQSPKC
jgi:hypothetical protein